MSVNIYFKETGLRNHKTVNKLNNVQFKTQNFRKDLNFELYLTNLLNKSIRPPSCGNGSFIAEHWARSFKNQCASRDCVCETLNLGVWCQSGTNLMNWLKSLNSSHIHRKKIKSLLSYYLLFMVSLPCE